jgi:hypothetical protein
VIVRSSDEGLGLEVDTSDEEPEERLNDEHSDVEHSEDIGSSNDSENEPSSPFTPKSQIPPPLGLSRRPGSPGAEGSATGKYDRQQPRQSS